MQRRLVVAVAATLLGASAGTADIIPTTTWLNSDFHVGPIIDVGAVLVNAYRTSWSEAVPLQGQSTVYGSYSGTVSAIPTSSRPESYSVAQYDFSASADQCLFDVAFDMSRATSGRPDYGYGINRAEVGASFRVRIDEPTELVMQGSLDSWANYEQMGTTALGWTYRLHQATQYTFNSYNTDWPVPPGELSPPPFSAVLDPGWYLFLWRAYIEADRSVTSPNNWPPSVGATASGRFSLSLRTVSPEAPPASEVPEPTTLSLLLAGLLCLGCLRLRRR